MLAGRGKFSQWRPESTGRYAGPWRVVCRSPVWTRVSLWVERAYWPFDHSAVTMPPEFLIESLAGIDPGAEAMPF